MKLTKPEKTNEELIEELKENVFKDGNKIIFEYGNYDSKIMIFGISPTEKHYNSDSNCVFAFDKNLKQTDYSGGVLCKLFSELNIKIYDIFWDNIYKVPENILTEKTKKLNIEYIKKIIDIMKPKIIICLGNNSESVIHKLQLEKNIKIIKVFHPATVIRGFYSQEEYNKMWEQLNLLEYIK